VEITDRLGQVVMKPDIGGYSTPNTEVITVGNIGEVYGMKDYVYTHPVNGFPVILLDTSNNRSANTKGGTT
jgi:hypothetical protein|tara:strand:- start:693 stop:905 length:213 start_codon:yes stop_codon:yes gene_type:complete